MTKIKFCGLSRTCDIEIAKELKPDYVGFVFASKSKRYVTPKTAEKLKRLLDPTIKAVGVFVNEDPEKIAYLLHSGIIDMVQLHGSEDEIYRNRLRRLADSPIIQAFRIKSANNIALVEHCTADYILLDSGAGTGSVFNWNLIQDITTPYFLAGGLSPDNVENAVTMLHPFAVDVSTGIETDGAKDKAKMAAFVAAVRKEDTI